jgi:K(+)-stimulated pyrophosphate-energized sodium pump
MFTRQVIGAVTGTAGMQQIAGAIKEGAEAFLKRLYKTAAAIPVLGLLLLIFSPGMAYAQPDHAGGGGEANLVLPDVRTVSFFGMNGYLCAVEEHAGSSLDARNFRTDL